MRKNILLITILFLGAIPHTTYADDIIKSDIPVVYTAQTQTDIIVPFDDVFEVESNAQILTKEPSPAVPSSLISLSLEGPGVSKTQSSSSASASRQSLVTYAKKFLGGTYVFGGDSLTDGVDCSGFVMRIFEQFGISTGRDSRSQAQKARTITESDLLPGDLVFYASGDYINHVGIFIGDGKIIHAANSNDGIIISNYKYRTPYMYGRFLN